MSIATTSPTAPPLYSPHPPSIKDLTLYFDRLSKLLKREEEADQARTSLLASNCSWEVLAQRGLALNGLGVSGISIGLGGKSLIALHRPSAFHTESALPSHTFRPGDPASVVPQEAVRKSAANRSSKKGAEDTEGGNGPVEGVVYKVTETTITLAVSPRDGEDLELPERCRLIKMANSGTFDRMEKAVERVRRLLGVPPTLVAAPVSSRDPEKDDVRSETVDEEETIEENPSTVAPRREDEEVVVATTALDLDAPSEPTTSPTPPTPLSAPPTLTTISNHPSFPLLRTLFGLEPPSSTPLDAPLVWFDETLNESQKVAVRFTLESDSVACIHGPPGTGKTFTLVEIIRQLVQIQKKKVLVCGASNLSVDNLLLRLSPLFPATSITRIGHPARILPSLLTRTLDYQTAHSSAAEIVKDVKSELEGYLSTLAKGRKEKGAVKGKKRGEVYGEVRELRKEFRVRESNVVRSVLSTTVIVLATCHTAGARQLMNMDFDVVIIDEATQALEAVCLIPILKAKKLILAGDPHQLPPTIISDTGKRRKDASKKAISRPIPPKSKTTSPETTDEPPTKKEEDSTPSDSDGEEEVVASSEKEEDYPSSEVAEATSTRRTHLRPSSSLEVTLFDRLERLFGPGIKRMLQVQYRMNSQIASFPSSALYSSLLISADSVASRTLLTLPTVEDPSEEATEFLEPPVVFMDTAGCEFYERGDGGEGGGSGVGEGSKLNENEAEVVRQYVEKLISFGVPPADVGVLAAYQAQVSHLSGLLKSLYPELLIGTVDSLQGQEREAIVLSLVRSNAKREVGFLSEERRLNVGMTRAKRQLCVVGDSATVANGSEYLKKWMSWLEENAEVRFAGDGV